jgi:hypothetical protein
MEGVFVNKQQLKFLKEMDKWLAKELWQTEVETEVAYKIRELITKIESKGYYSQTEADVLNLMREEFIKHKKKK